MELGHTLSHALRPALKPALLIIAIFASLVMYLVLTATPRREKHEPSHSQGASLGRDYAARAVHEFARAGLQSKKLRVRLSRAEFEDAVQGSAVQGSAVQGSAVQGPANENITALYFPGDCPDYTSDVLVRTGAPPLEKYIVPEPGSLVLVRGPFEWTRDPASVAGFEVWAPHASAPHASAPHASAPHASAPQASAPQASAPHASAPHASVPKSQKNKADDKA